LWGINRLFVSERVKEGFVGRVRGYKRAVWHRYKHNIFNPFRDEQLNLAGHRANQVCHFSSLSIFCWDAERSAGELPAG